uniref:uncharacterized protein LOC100183944 isoform X2 n=1 Tax=Ciona intestinalis TaxID=7719 RepID=UPI000EF47F98|nr:uncharacterized protein LOC100183944 isoform X2 [Ciona intestinalis]|eukprot:XP_026690995.1 uncharacterized protein LOC100183944 isoform X2 [Ciona intestinalis]
MPLVKQVLKSCRLLIAIPVTRFATRSRRNSTKVCHGIFKHFDAKVTSLLQEGRYLQQNKDGLFEPDIMLCELIQNLKSEWWRNFALVKTNCYDFKVGQIYSNTFDVMDQFVPSNGFSVSPEKPTIVLNMMSHLPLNDVSQRCIYDGLFLMRITEMKNISLEFDNMQSSQSQWAKKYFHRIAQLQANAANNKSDINPSRSSNIFKPQSGIELSVQEYSSHKNLPVALNRVVCQSKDWKDSQVSVVCTKVNLLELAAAILLDSYHEIIIDDYKQIMLRLHRHIAPVKIAILIEGNETSSLSQIQAHISEVKEKMFLYFNPR